MQQEISNATDASVRKYNEVTPFEEKNTEGVANAMRFGEKERASKLISKMGKLLAVANPAHGPGFLEEVRKYE